MLWHRDGAWIRCSTRKLGKLASKGLRKDFDLWLSNRGFAQLIVTATVYGDGSISVEINHAIPTEAFSGTAKQDRAVAQAI